MNAFKAILISIFCFVSCKILPAQSISVSGYTKDVETGEALIGTSVYLLSNNSGAITNEYGYFSIQSDPDTLVLRISYIGYTTKELRFFCNRDTLLNIEIAPIETKAGEVFIQANSLRDKLSSTQLSVEEISVVDAKVLPALFGEVDIIKTLQLKPGVQSGGEGLSGLYVRGGGPDQNLILLDEAPVYNASHLFGFFSTFNTDAVKSVKLYKGGFPAEYGGKLSSVLDIRLKDGNRKKISGAGGVGLIASRLNLEGPIVKDKASFIVAGRRTYFDAITRQVNKINEGKEGFDPIPDYYFYDLNTKVSFDLGEKDKIFLSGYFGRDVFGFNSGNFGVDFTWGNATGTARWLHLFSPKSFLKTFVTFSDYNYAITGRFSVFNFKIGSGVRDVNVKTEWNWLPSNKHSVKAGLNYIYHTFTIGRLNASNGDSSIIADFGSQFYGTELGAYISETFEASTRLKLDFGARYSAFVGQGKFYNGIEPRLAAKYSLSKQVSLKANLVRTFQYIHLVSNSGASLPTDIWYPSNEAVRPQRGDQAAIGINWLINEDLLFSNEVYYKWQQNQVDFRDGAQLFVNENLDQEFVFGKGWAYGNEIYLEKKNGKTHGWIGYTLSWSWRSFQEIMEGRKFNPRYDRRHDASIVVIHELSRHINLTGTWVYGTGNAVSLPVGRYIAFDAIPGSDPIVVPLFTERNGFRMPAYHRMDLGCVYKFFPKWGEADLTLSVYNAYNRRNAYFIYFDTLRDENDNITGFAAKQVSLFPIIPSLAFNFKF